MFDGEWIHYQLRLKGTKAKARQHPPSSGVSRVRSRSVEQYRDSDDLPSEFDTGMWPLENCIQPSAGSHIRSYRNHSSSDGIGGRFSSI